MNWALMLTVLLTACATVGQSTDVVNHPSLRFKCHHGFGRQGGLICWARDRRPAKEFAVDRLSQVRRLTASTTSMSNSTTITCQGDHDRPTTCGPTSDVHHGRGSRWTLWFL